MKIGIDISQSVYTGTGVASYTRNLVKALLEMDDQEYVLFGSAFGRQKELLDFMQSLPKKASVTSKIFSLPPTLLALLWNRLHIGGIEKFIGKVDIFHSSDWTEPPAKIPKITTIHDVILFKYPEHFPEEIIDNQKARLNLVKKESAAIIADSLSTKDDIVQFLGIPPQKIHVIYLGVDDKFFPRKIDEIIKVKKKYKIESDYILSIGTREPRKNLIRTIEAFKTLKQKDVNLVIGGNFGWGEDVGTTDNVQILGFVDTVDLPALYSGAACFVYPSLYEGFGLPILEALSCGIPVVTSNRGSLGEIADTFSIEVDPEKTDAIADGIKKIVTLSKRDRAVMVKKGLKHAEQYTWKKCAEETVKVYKSVI